MEESIFWNQISQGEISVEKLSQFDETFKKKIIEMCHSIATYFTKDNPVQYNDPNDGYSGFHLKSDELFDFMYSIITKGKDKYDEFIKNPFEGCIWSFTSCGISCGNSSGEYLNPQPHGLIEIIYEKKINDDESLSNDEKSSNDELLSDSVSEEEKQTYYYPQEQDFLNKIFDIAIGPYF